MPFDSSQHAFRLLSEQVKRDELHVVPFVGAGLSVYGSPEERLPLWGKLLTRLHARAEEYGLLKPSESRRIQDLIESHDLIEATDTLVNAVQLRQFRIFIEDVLDVSDKQIPPAILELVCISWSLIVTTNLDHFLEKAWLEKYGEPIDVVTHAEEVRLIRAVTSQMGTRGAVLVKLHGSLERYETWVLTQTQYDYLLQRKPAYREALRSLFLRTIFFIGYGFGDSDITTLHSHIISIYPAGVRQFFAILDRRLKGTDTITALLRDYGLQPIWYTYDPSRADHADGGHGEVFECLQALVRAWAKGRDDVAVTLKYFPELDPDFVGREEELEALGDSLARDTPQDVQVVGFGGEGKTSLVQQYLFRHRIDLGLAGYKRVFGCSFYRADVGRFVQDAYAALHGAADIVDVRSKVTALRVLLEHERILLVLDGLEAYQDEEGRLTNPYLRDIVETALNSQAVVLVTTRIPLPYQLRELRLGPLRSEDTARLLKQWGITLDDREGRLLVQRKVGNHALSVRIFAGYAKGAKGSFGTDQLRTLKLPRLVDETDPRILNKAARILQHYEKNLPRDQLAFMRCFSVFSRPTSPPLVFVAFSQPITGTDINRDLLLADLRVTVSRLLERRLLITEGGSFLTLHPLVRDYFLERTPSADLKALHRAVAATYLTHLEGEVPNTLEEAQSLLDLCYHAAKAEDWGLYHDIFYRRINREHENYLGNVLGAWEEFLYLARLSFPNEDTSLLPAIQSVYYKSSVARAYKHLGQVQLAREQYLDCLHLAVEKHDPETSRYANNFLSLCIFAGELVTATELAKLNLRTLSWCREEWRRLWQREFALFSIGYLAALLGDLETGERYCASASHVWDSKGDRREWFFDYYRVHYSDILLARSRGNWQRAHAIAELSLRLGEEYSWDETAAVAHRSLASILRARYRESEGGDEFVDEAAEHLALAREVGERMYIPKLVIETGLETLHWEVLRFTLAQRSRSITAIKADLDSLVEAVKESHLALFWPELYALRGWVALMEGDRPRALMECQRSVTHSMRLKKRLAVLDANGVVAALVHYLGVEVPEEGWYRRPALPASEALEGRPVSQSEARVILRGLQSVDLGTA